MNLKVVSCWIIILFAGLPLSHLSAQSQTIDGLTIKQTVRWSGTLTIRGDVVVAPTGILIIEPGTEIYFAPNTDQSKSGQDKTRSEIVVQGVLIANGTATSKITFSSSAGQPKMGDWYGINIASSRQGTELNYVLIEYAYNGLMIKKSSPQISNSQIRYNFYSGLTIEIKSNPKLDANIISENGYAGIVCRLGSNPVLSNNIITLNQIGIIAFGNSSPNLGSLTQGADYNIGQNTIVDNQEYDIHNHSSQGIKAENNTWGSTNIKDIAVAIYDAEDEAKYGVVDVTPVFRSRENMTRRNLVSQFSSTIAENPVAANTTENRPNQTNSAPGSQLQPPVTSSVVNQNTPVSVAQNMISKPASVAESSAVLPLQNQDDEMPLLASNENTSEPANETLPEKEEVAAPPQIDYEQIFLDVFLDEKKSIIHQETPEIRNIKMGMGAHGNVIVRVVVNKIGLVESASLLKSLNYYFDELSIESAKKFRFKPGKINDKPVRFSTVLVFKF